MRKNKYELALLIEDQNAERNKGGGEDVKTNSHPGNVFELGEQARGGRGVE